MSESELLGLLAQAPRGQVAVILLLLFTRWQAGRFMQGARLPWLVSVATSGAATVIVAVFALILVLSSGLVALLTTWPLEETLRDSELWRLWVDDRIRTVWCLLLEMLVATMILRVLAGRWERLAAVLESPVGTVIDVPPGGARPHHTEAG